MQVFEVSVVNLVRDSWLLYIYFFLLFFGNHKADVASASPECYKQRSISVSFQGFDVPSELKKICFFSANSSLRDFLVQELRGKGHISTQESNVCLFISSLERLYTCQSFEKAKNLAEEGLMRYFMSFYILW